MTEVEVIEPFKYGGETLEEETVADLPDSVAQSAIDRGYTEETGGVRRRHRAVLKRRGSRATCRRNGARPGRVGKGSGAERGWRSGRGSAARGAGTSKRKFIDNFTFTVLGIFSPILRKLILLAISR